jgi:hypothetical protein
MRLKKGRVPIAQVPEITDIREVSRADLVHLTVKRPTTTLQTLRDNHHRVARAFASGLSNQDVATTCGISVTRVSMLRKDPAMQELTAHYRSMLTAEWVKEADPVTELLRSNAMKAQAMLSDKLDEAAENGEYLPTRDLLGIAELGLDRTGYGKVNKNLNVNVDFAAKLEAARHRSSRAREVGAPSRAPQPTPAGTPPSSARLPGPPLRRL